MNERLVITPLGPYIGAQVENVVLSKPLSGGLSSCVSSTMISSTSGACGYTG